MSDPGLSTGLESEQAEARARQPNGHALIILWVTVGWWAARLAVYVTADVMRHAPRLGEMAAMRGLLALFGLALCFSIYRILQRLRHNALWVRALALVVAAPILAELFNWAAYFGFGYVYGNVFGPIDWSAAIRTNLEETWFLVSLGGLYLAIEYAASAKEEHRRASDYMRIAHAAKLRALHNQINPHFLFNSLNSISALIGEKRTQEADRMIDLLATFFRKTLAVDPSSDVRLEDEVGLQMGYLAIEQARYPDLAVELDIPNDLKDVPVPALLLQPIVENAVKHGIARSRPPARVAIRAKREGNHLLISIENHGAASAPVKTGTGIGLQNVRARLESRFGDPSALTTRAIPTGGYQAIMRLPMVAT